MDSLDTIHSMFTKRYIVDFNKIQFIFINQICINHNFSKPYNFSKLYRSMKLYRYRVILIFLYSI